MSLRAYLLQMMGLASVEDDAEACHEHRYSPQPARDPFDYDARGDGLRRFCTSAERLRAARIPTRSSAQPSQLPVLKSTNASKRSVSRACPPSGTAM